MTETKPAASRAATYGVVVLSGWQKHLLTFLMVFGPGYLAVMTSMLGCHVLNSAAVLRR